MHNQPNHQRCWNELTTYCSTHTTYRRKCMPQDRGSRSACWAAVSTGEYCTVSTTFLFNFTAWSALFSEKAQHGFPSPRNWSPAPSVSLSDSISQQQSTTGSQPALHPDKYPVEVLWSIGDCWEDLNSGVTKSNKSRPPMDRVVRREDGSLISTLEWNAIKASAWLLKHELRLLPTPTDRQAQLQAKTKVYYRSYHSREWLRAVQWLEEEQPLLRLCASHWKAEHVLNGSHEWQAQRDW